MNIPNDILEYAEKLGLDTVSTGGGFDYVYIEPRYKSPYVCIILASKSCDGSPDNLESPCSLLIMLTDNWDTGIEIPFSTAKEAMDKMHDIYFYGNVW